VTPYKVESYRVGEWNETRYRILVDGRVVDDAQGYGYKTAAKAHAAWNYKNGGRQRQLEKTKSAKEWLKSFPKLKAEFDELVEWNFKQIALGEYTLADIFAQSRTETRNCYSFGSSMVFKTIGHL
jgi:hypothetical protein